MAMRTIYVPGEQADIWEQFSVAAGEAGLSMSALLLLLVRAYLDGKLKYVSGSLDTVEAP